MSQKPACEELEQRLKACEKKIAELERSKERLQADKEKYIRLLENLNDIIYTLDKNGRVTYISPNIERLAGYLPEQITGRKYSDFVADENTENMGSNFRRALAGERVVSEHKYATRNKGAVWTVNRAGPVYEDGEITGVQGVLVDITERKTAEEALKDSERKYRNIFENMQVGVFRTELATGKMLEANDALAYFAGYRSASDLLNDNYNIADHYKKPADRKKMLEILEEKGEVRGFEAPFVSLDGKIRWIRFSARITENKKWIEGVSEDITKHKQDREKLEKSRQDFWNTLESLNEIVVQMDTNFVISVSNRAASEIMGIPRDKFAGSRCFELFYGRKTPCPGCPAEKAMNTGNPVSAPRYRPDGTILDRTVYPIFDAKGRIKGVTILGLDITARRRAEEELRESEKKYRNILETIEDGYYETDLAGNLTFFNDSLCRIFGYSADEMKGMNYRVYTDEENRRKLFEIFNRTYRTGLSEKGYSWEITRKDGSKRYIQASVALIKDAEGRAEGFRGIARDITEQKRLEARLQQAQKMESIGTLAGGIAHNFNNILMGIQGRTSLIIADKYTSSPDFEHLREIEEYVRIAKEMTDDLLGFARAGKYEVKPTDLNSLIKKQNRTFGQTKKEIQVHGKYTKNLWPVEVDQGQIQQALMNLYVNAWQAMPEGGDLHIRTENISIEETDIKSMEIPPGQYVKVSVTDTGEGMDDQTRKKIFDPFFTTRETGLGTGLGLASVYGIVKNHAGFINVYSEKGRGTTFSIYLPASDKAPAEEIHASEKHEVRCGQGTVLLVDDEDMVIDVGQKLLEKLGYRVLTAGSGEDAIEIFEEKRSDIELVILDMIMPGLGGGETFNRLKRIDDNVKVILSSGYSLHGQAKEIMDSGCRGFIQKPFSMKDLSVKIKEVLEDEQPD